MMMNEFIKPHYTWRRLSDDSIRQTELTSLLKGEIITHSINGMMPCGQDVQRFATLRTSSQDGYLRTSYGSMQEQWAYPVHHNAYKKFSFLSSFSLLSEWNKRYVQIRAIGVENICDSVWLRDEIFV